jgi:hypothetical protein
MSFNPVPPFLPTMFRLSFMCLLFGHKWQATIYRGGWVGEHCPRCFRTRNVRPEVAT